MCSLIDSGARREHGGIWMWRSWNGGDLPARDVYIVRLSTAGDVYSGD